MRWWSAVLLLATLVAAAAPPPSAAQVDLGGCSWLTRTDPVVLNVYLPDKDATYYASRLPTGIAWHLEGTFPHARYMSLASSRGGPIDTLHDAEIDASPGGTNPFRPGADRTATVRDYRIDLVAADPPADPADRAANTLYLGADPGPVHLVHRIYLPDAGTGLTGGVPLPRLVADVGGMPVEVPLECPFVPSMPDLQDAYANLPAVPLPASAQASPPQWTSRDGVLGERLGAEVLPGNTDNRYLLARVDRMQGDLVALRGLAPTTPPTRDGQPVMGDGELRYWSLCMNSRTMRYLDCLSDSDIAVDADGSFTIVVSTPAARPPSATNWLPFGPEPMGTLLLRHMLPSGAFWPYSAQGWTEGLVLNDTMGPFYPRAVYCTAAEFEAARCGLDEALAVPSGLRATNGTSSAAPVAPTVVAPARPEPTSPPSSVAAPEAAGDDRSASTSVTDAPPLAEHAPIQAKPQESPGLGLLVVAVVLGLALVLRRR